jgi:hypothetical protein
MASHHGPSNQSLTLTARAGLCFAGRSATRWVWLAQIGRRAEANAQARGADLIRNCRERAGGCDDG